MLQWVYSKVKLLEDILLANRLQIHRDKVDKEIKEELILDFAKPFGGFLKATAVKSTSRKRDENLKDLFTQFGEPTEDEHQMAKEMEEYMLKNGFLVPRWARATYIMTFLFLFITLLIHFYKADFVNLTVCTVAIHLL